MIRKPSRTEVIKPPRHIRQKIGSSGGIEIEEAIARADQVVAQISETFLGDIAPELLSLEKAFAAAMAAPAEADRQRAALFNAAHEIRGQSGTFGYPLATVFADSLCKILDATEGLSVKDLDLVGVHVKALQTIFRQNLKHDGGSVGAELRRLLASRLKGHAETQAGNSS